MHRRPLVDCRVNELNWSDVVVTYLVSPETSAGDEEETLALARCGSFCDNTRHVDGCDAITVTFGLRRAEKVDDRWKHVKYVKQQELFAD